MSQVFYVAQDEEILSIIGRLRASRMLENVFVVPKRALILGSGVNLRLLAREAEKAGKRILIVTQDEEGRTLAEKAGVPTKPYSEELLREEGPRQRSDAAARIREPESEPERMEPEEDEFRVPAETLGSDTFFSAGSEPEPSGETERRGTDGLRIRVRGNDPSRLTSLNSMREEDRREIPAPRPAPILRPVSVLPRRPVMPASAPIARTHVPTPESGRLAEVFRSGHRATSAPEPKRERRNDKERHTENPRKGTRQESRSGMEGNSWFLFFAGISVLFLFGTLALILLPKAVIEIVPESVSKSMELSFDGKTGTASGEREIPIRTIDLEEEVTVTVDSTGTPSSSGQKAVGSVVIYNEFSSSPQSLVATTRLETPDGKIFRITKGVTVPGMTEQGGVMTPGAVEVAVVADEAGEAYDVAPTRFTVPGFKGNPKFDKFYARSTVAMKGGSTGGGNGVATVSEADIRTASAAAEAEFRKRFESKLLGSSGDDERFIPESVSVSVSGNPIYPETGFATASFEYRATFVGKAFLFSESELKRKAALILEDGASLDRGYSVQDITMEYLGEAADYAAERFPIPIRATALFVADIDIAEVRNDFLGKRKSDISDILAKHAEIRRVNLSWPLPTAFPKKIRQLDVRILGPSD